MDGYSTSNRRCVKSKRLLDRGLLDTYSKNRAGAIYGLEEYSGMNFLILELVEGATLEDPLKRGSIPVEGSKSVQSRTI
jgi:hypothetical protein